MYVGYNTLLGAFSIRQDLLFEGGPNDTSVQRRILKRFMAYANAYTDSRPANQRSNDTLTCGYDGFFRGYRLLFNCWALEFHLGNSRHIPLE